MSDKWSCKFGPTWHSSDKSIDSDSDIGWIEVQDDAGNTVAMVTDEGGGLTIQSADREMERRAHLIAAAPELYEALKELVSIVDIHSEQTGKNFAWAEITEARAAMAKARGEV